MYRKAIEDLIRWKSLPSSERLPLVIKGARQVGKTWLMREFGITLRRVLRPPSQPSKLGCTRPCGHGIRSRNVEKRNNHYQRAVYSNLERDIDMRAAFLKDKDIRDPDDILHRIGQLAGGPLSNDGSELLILDELQTVLRFGEFCVHFEHLKKIFFRRSKT